MSSSFTHLRAHFSHCILGEEFFEEDVTVTSGACAGWAEAASSDKVGGVPGGVLGCKHGRDESMESLEVSALESTSIGSSTSRAVVGAVSVCKGSLKTLASFPFCQAQFQLAIALTIELSLALLSTLNHPATQPPTR